jgi:hypothetical protein
MWSSIKKGFGYAFGGRIGWELGGLVWRWVSRLVMLAVLGIGTQCTAHNYTDGAAKAKAQQAQAASEKPRHHRQAKTEAPAQTDTVPNPTAINQ